MKRIFLATEIVDYGWPDPGHREFILVYSSPRKNKFWQKLLGNKCETLKSYGERKPSDNEVETDIEERKSLLI